MIKPLIRRTVRSLALSIMARPALAAAAKKLVRLSPALDQRLRRILGRTPPGAGLHPPSTESQAQEPSPVPPEVARVLVDLRHAMAEHKPESRAS